MLLIIRAIVVPCSPPQKEATLQLRTPCYFHTIARRGSRDGITSIEINVATLIFQPRCQICQSSHNGTTQASRMHRSSQEEVPNTAELYGIKSSKQWHRQKVRILTVSEWGKAKYVRPRPHNDEAAVRASEKQQSQPTLHQRYGAQLAHVSELSASPFESLPTSSSSESSLPYATSACQDIESSTATLLNVEGYGDTPSVTD
jgi:hypothetical protein